MERQEIFCKGVLRLNEDNKQQLVFGYVAEMLELWEEEWQDMPEFVQEDETPYQQIIVSFRNEKDVQNFAKLTNQGLTNQTKSAWYPPCDREKPSNFLYVSEKINPKYPIYIVSKGRWESRLTSKILEKMNVPYKIVVEKVNIKNTKQL